MEVLGVRDSVEGVKEVMKDSVHLKEEAVDKSMDYVLEKVEEQLTSRKRGPTGGGGPADKRSRQVVSVGGYERMRGRGGSFRGDRGGGRGGGWAGRSNTYN